MASVRNVDRVKAVLERVRLRTLQKGANGLKVAGLYLLQKSQEIVPVEFGNLKATGYCQANSFFGGSPPLIEVVVGYTALYAIFVHENLDALHGAAFNAAYVYQRSISQEHYRSAQADLRRARKGYDGGFVDVEAVEKASRNAQSKYASMVHWALRGENQQAKFLEQPARQFRQDIRNIIREYLTA